MRRGINVKYTHELDEVISVLKNASCFVKDKKRVRMALKYTKKGVGEENGIVDRHYKEMYKFEEGGRFWYKDHNYINLKGTEVRLYNIDEFFKEFADNEGKTCKNCGEYERAECVRHSWGGYSIKWRKNRFASHLISQKERVRRQEEYGYVYKDHLCKRCDDSIQNYYNSKDLKINYIDSEFDEKITEHAFCMHILAKFKKEITKKMKEARNNEQEVSTT